MNNIVSIIVLARNEEDTIRDLLKQLLAERLPKGVKKQLIVFANGCTDKTVPIVEAMQKRHPTIELFNLNKASKPFSWTLAQAHAAGDTLVYCDADIKIKRGSVSALANTLRENPNALVATSESNLQTQTFLQRAASLGMEREQRTDQVGAIGGFYAIRKGAVREIPLHILNEDQYIASLIPREKRVHCPKACFSVSTPTKLNQILEQKTRVHTGVIQLAQTDPRILEERNAWKRLKEIWRSTTTKEKITYLPTYLGLATTVRVLAAIRHHRKYYTWKKIKQPKVK